MHPFLEKARKYFRREPRFSVEEVEKRVMAGLLEPGISIDDYPSTFAEGVKRLVAQEIAFMIEDGRKLNEQAVEQAIRDLRGDFHRAWIRFVME